MQSQLIDFWARFQSGIEVAVGSSESDKLLGVRDGFLRYFHDGLERPVPVAVSPEAGFQDSSYLALSDGEMLDLARRRARELQNRYEDRFPFYACTETGLHSVDVEGESNYFVRSWTVICGMVGESYGGSGSLQLPGYLIEGLDSERVPFAIPGRRRRGGMNGSLTGGLESRRRAIALATLHALSTLLYGILESRPVRSVVR